MIDPVLISLGPLQIRYYGLVYAIGFLIIYYLLEKSHKKLHLQKEEVGDLVLWIGLGMIIGGRIVHFLFDDPSIFLRPWEILFIWQGGMAFFGGLLGMILGGWLFLRKKKTKVVDIIDLLAAPAALMLGFGRIANFINQELVGTITSVPWCMEFLYHDGCRHPYQLYAAATHFLLFIILLFVSKKQGVRTYTLLLGYGALRFFTDFFREDPRFFGLSVWQILCLLLIIIVLWRLYNEKTKTSKHKE